MMAMLTAESIAKGTAGGPERLAQRRARGRRYLRSELTGLARLFRAGRLRDCRILRGLLGCPAGRPLFGDRGIDAGRPGARRPGEPSASPPPLVSAAGRPG